MTHEDILAIVAMLALALPIFTTFGAAIGSWSTARSKASHEEVERLRRKIDVLITENIDLKAQNDLLREQLHEQQEENILLRGILQSHNIKIPTRLDESGADAAKSRKEKTQPRKGD